MRLAGVDAPEANDGCGPNATAAVNALAGPGAAVDVEAAELPLDTRTGRHRAYIRVSHAGERWTLQELLLQDGLARMDRGGRFETTWYTTWFDAAERMARGASLGIWGDHCAGLFEEFGEALPPEHTGQTVFAARLVGRVGDRFARYQLEYPGDGSTYTINLHTRPADGAMLRNAGFRVYGPQAGKLYATGGAQPGLYPSVAANLSSREPGVYTIQVYNYNPGVTMEYELSVDAGLEPILLTVAPP